MVCGRFYSLRVESPSGYDILQYLGFSAQPPSCGARHERGRANNPQKARGFGHVAQHGVHHHIMGMRPHVSHTTSAAAACRRLTRVECWMIVAHFQTGGYVEPSRTAMGHGWQATALRPQEKRRTGIVQVLQLAAPPGQRRPSSVGRRSAVPVRPVEPRRWPPGPQSRARCNRSLAEPPGCAGRDRAAGAGPRA